MEEVKVRLCHADHRSQLLPHRHHGEKVLGDVLWHRQRGDEIFARQSLVDEFGHAEVDLRGRVLGLNAHRTRRRRDLRH